MTPGRPDDPIPPVPRPSLAGRVANAPIGDWRIGAAVATLLAAGPLVTIGGAAVLRAGALAEASQFREAMASRGQAAQANAAARAALAPLLARPALGTTIEALARALPPDARLVRVERTAQGALEIDVATPDPDPLRAALRRVPVLSGLRDVRQQRTDGAMIVSFRIDRE